MPAFADPCCKHHMAALSILCTQSCLPHARAFQKSSDYITHSTWSFRDGYTLGRHHGEEHTFSVISQLFVIWLAPFHVTLIGKAGNTVHNGEAIDQDRQQFSGQHRSYGKNGAGHESGRGQVCLPAGHTRIHCRPLRHAAGGLQLLDCSATNPAIACSHLRGEVPKREPLVTACDASLSFVCTLEKLAS